MSNPKEREERIVGESAYSCQPLKALSICQWPLEIESHVAISHTDDSRHKFPTLISQGLELILS